MTLPQIIILSIVEGLTEFLPISSTGHLILAQRYLSIATTEFTKTFDIVIQLAAILAVVVLFRDKLFTSLKVWKQSLIAFIPTGIIGFVLYKIIRNVLLENPMITVYSLFFGGLVLLAVDRYKKLNDNKGKFTELRPVQLAVIGVFQAISVLPGVSRSAAAIVGGLATGLSRSQAVEFSFFLAMPTMAAASAYDLLKSGLNFTSTEYLLLATGCIFSFISATISVKFFINYVKKHNFTSFAIYRILLALVVFFTLKS